MIFTAVVSLLNAVGWTGYCFLGGAFLDLTEIATVQGSTILGFFLCSAIAGLVSFHCTHVFGNILLNALHNILTTAIASAPLILAILPRSLLDDPDCLGWGTVIVITVLYGIVYLFYFTWCIWPTYGMGIDEGEVDLFRLSIRVFVIYIMLCLASMFPQLDVGQYALGYGLLTSIPVSLVLAIRSKIMDK